MKKSLYLIAIVLILSGCGVLQSAIKSTLPYTATLTIPRSSTVGDELSVTAPAGSFDQRINKAGNNADQVSDVRVVSARIRSVDPSDFNIGNLVWVKVYLSRVNGKDEVLVASRMDITSGVGNSLVLDIEDTKQLDNLLHDEKMQVKLVYKLHNHINQNTSVRVVLGLSANPGAR
ncbi:MAG TPA: hypothetical protein VNW95_12140 [Mucilaginibacter sp.]|jgi:hypothetical protein|nr:hypothetical protein [Mucilaginibacter sp.]